MDELVRAREEIRRGNYASAETTLDGIIDGPDEITSHLLFDIACAYEELFSATGRYEDLITSCRRCAAKTERLSPLDAQIHSAHTLIVTAGAEGALGRRDDAQRHARAAERLLSQFSVGQFGPGSKERVNRLHVRLKSLKRTISDVAPALPLRSQDSGVHSSAGSGEWRIFASQKSLSGRDVKTCFAKMRRSAGPAESFAIVVEWALSTPRAGNIGANAEAFSALVEELALVAAAHSLPFDSQRKLSRLLHEWEQADSSWLQRLIAANRKCGLAERLQRLRRALEEKLQDRLRSAEKRIAELESLDSGAILDAADQDHEAILLQLESELGELGSFVPSSLSTPLDRRKGEVAWIIERVDRELSRRNTTYTRLLEAIAQAPNQSALGRLKAEVMEQLPATMQTRPELQQAFREAEDRLLMVGLEALENQERAVHRAKLNSVRGVDLANLLFREYGVDLPTARKLVIDRNKGAIDIDGLLDSVVELQKRARQRSVSPTPRAMHSVEPGESGEH